ncbi:CDP-glycerol glycerophosphotransferase family protein [Pediococcus siamensis]|uniref:bifunctional glycosyltransferase/CDP-glycerol:glycerophosphate glycerophosphotransferase n=1 Tax=Pediococcus siamensis TaxID=381829 RepID=UPI00399F2801
MAKSILLSVVVACYNVSEYLAECLDSLANQTYKKIEVILIDDCSTDDGKTASLVEAYGERYDNFFAYHNEHNLGLSDTRNKGIRLAKGEYIAFVDGDDIVPANAYLNLVGSVTETHSQVATGFVRRFDKNRDKPSYLHKFAISDTIQKTNLEQNPELVYDSTSWNKLYNLKMVREHQMKFPANMLYEDIPFVMQAFTIASQETSIDVLSNVVYRWRWRDGDSKSITQVKNAMKPYGDRLKILNMVRDYFISQQVSPAILQEFYIKVLKIDIPLFMDDIADADENFIMDFQRATYLFLRDWQLIDSELYTQLSIKMQSQYKALLSGNFAELKRYSYSGFKGKLSKRFIHHFFTPKLKDAKNQKVKNKLLSVKLLDNDPKSVQIEGYVQPTDYKLHRIWFSSHNLNEQLVAKLVNIETGKERQVQIHRFQSAGNFHLKRQPEPYAHYLVQFDFAEALRTLGAGSWKLKIVINTHGQTLESFAGQPVRRSGKMHAFTDEATHLNVSQKFNKHWELVFVVKEVLNVASRTETAGMNSLLGVAVAGRSLKLTFALQNEALQPALRLNGQEIGRLDKRYHDGLAADFLIDLDEFQANQGVMKKLAMIDTATNLPIEYAINHAKKNEILTIEGQNIFISYQGSSDIWLMKETQIAEILRAEWQEDEAQSNLVLEIANKAAFDNLDLDGTGTIELLSTNKKNRYLSIGHVEKSAEGFVGTLPLLQQEKLQVLGGSYKIYFVLHGTNMNLRVRVFDANHRMEQLAPQQTKNATFTLTQSADGFAVLKVTQVAFWMDRTKLRRGISYSILYPLMRLLPIDKKLVIFESYWGQYFNGSPKAIYDYLRENHPELKFVWILTNDQISIEGNGKVVKRLGFKYWYYMARAKYLVQNTNFPNQYSKRAGQIEVETLHGTFMKTMGFDEPHFKHASGRVQRNFAIRNDRWDLLTVPSTYMAETAVKAFDYKQEVAKSGFPRNDALYAHNNQQYIMAIKNKLRIPLDKKVVLYAPTFRSNSNTFDFELDLDKLREKLSDEYVVLVRLHYFVAHSMSFLDHSGFVFDASDYPDIADLYLISDVMITDYSSVMFDYGYLKKPMIFFAYDKDWYLNGDNRGVYLDYDETVPGPIVENTEEIVAWLQKLPVLQQTYANKMDAFYDKFCEFGREGTASKEISERMLQLQPTEQGSIVKHLFWKKILRVSRLNNLQSRLLNFLSRHLKKKNIMIFESFFGTQYSDSPKAIYLYMKKNHPEYRLYWNVNKNNVAYFKEHQIPYITRFGYKGIFKQAQAKYWITNTRRPFRWQKPKDAKLIQTWHGTPLKTIGTDVQNVTMPGVTQRRYHKQVIRDSARWDYLVAPNEYSYTIMQRAFRKSYHQMISSGYPRNDVLQRPSLSQIGTIKQNLQIATDQKVVLYAPTWRDNEYVKVDEYQAKLHLDLDLLLEKLPQDVTILIRTHYLIANQLDLSNYGSRVINVSDYEDITELYLIADVLITDYSSVMFDYANLKRPMLFFAYDLEDYGDAIRGFYFDYEENVPGPIVKTNTDLVQVLTDMLHNPQHYTQTERYQRFVDKFTQWETGNSTQTLVEYVLQDKKYGIDSQPLEKQEVVIQDGSQFWGDLPERRPLSFVRNYDQRATHHYVQLQAARIQDPIRQRAVGDTYVQVVERSDTQNPVWVRAEDIHS